MKLWYQSATANWQAGLPIGTGRLAAMILGDAGQERMALNHEWLWRGKHRNREPDKSAHLLPRVRELIMDGNYEEGNIAGNDAFAGLGGRKRATHPPRVDAYQPAGDFSICRHHGGVSDYRRELDMERGLVTVSYQAGGVACKSEFLAHIEHDLLLVRVSADKRIDAEFRLRRTEDAGCFLHYRCHGDTLMMDGHFEQGIGFRVEARLLATDGSACFHDDCLELAEAREAVLAINIGTSAKACSPAEECSRYLSPGEAWKELLQSNAAAIQQHLGKVKLEIPDSRSGVPTDERLRAMRAGKADPGMAVIYFQYGRYLLMACSANGELPANLQGKWNEEIEPPWECDYHHNINLQMNYWAAEAGNLAAAAEALFKHMERFVPHARKAARDLYGCRGICFPTQTDCWGRATPESWGVAAWIGAAAWLAQHLWWHYEYSLDETFLRMCAYPFFKEVASFYESYLIEDESGVLQIVPSQSPENRFEGAGNVPVSLCVSSAMDVQLARNVFNYALRSAEIIGVDPGKQSCWQKMAGKLPRLKIGRRGQLQEWNEDFEECEPAHRHLSHLIGLYPGDEIDPEKTPQLWKAARRSLELRLEAGGGHTGWGRAWISCLFARLGEAGPAWEHLCHLITDFATDSLLDLYPPRIFQIDGNFGGTAAVLEMLLQSYRGELHFLPALPGEWPNGRVSGLRARGGITVGIVWRDGRLEQASLSGSFSRECTIIHAPRNCLIRDDAGRPVPFERRGIRTVFAMKADESYSLFDMDYC